MIQRFFGTLVRHLDAPLLGLLTLLLLASTAVVFSAAGENSERLYAHLTNIGVALTAMLLVSHIPPQRLMQFALPVYVVGVLLQQGRRREYLIRRAAIPFPDARVAHPGRSDTGT